MRKLFLSAVALGAILSGCNAPTNEGTVVRYAKEAKWEDVRDDLKIAIANKGLRIEYTSHIHNMLERTKKDVGGTKDIFANAETFVFCSAVVSRHTMEADPNNIAFCPYAMAVYTTKDDPKTVNVSFRRPVRTNGSAAAKSSLKEVETLLDGLAKEALGISN